MILSGTLSNIHHWELTFSSDSYTHAAFGIIDMLEPHAYVFNSVPTLGNVAFCYTTGGCTLLL